MLILISIIFWPISTFAVELTAPCPSSALYYDDGRSAGCQLRGEAASKPIRVGVWYARNSEGQIVRETSYDEQGRIHGLMRIWNHPGRDPVSPDKNLRQSIRYVHGLWHGLTKYWLPDGKPDGLRCFIRGERASLHECATANIVIAR